MSSAVAPELIAASSSGASDQRAIDASCTAPVTAFFVTAIFWLLVGSVLGLLAAIKLHTPGFFGGSAALTFGRIRPAHMHTSIYGWSCLAGIGALLWMTARLCRTPLPLGRLLVAACVLWNAGVAGGLVAILGGASSGIEWLELPRFWALLLAAVFGLILLVSLALFAGRPRGHIYVSLWYLLAAAVWFPFLYLLANTLIRSGALRGVPQATAGWWFAHNLLGLWLVPVGLAAAYYLIPLLVGRPIYSYRLSLLGFWTLAVVYNWAGTHHLIGGPLPAWLVTVGIAAGVLMLLPVIIVAANHHLTVWGHFDALRRSLPLRFIVCGAVSYTLVSLQGALQALRTVQAVTHFTHATVGHAHLGTYAFHAMTMCGVIYYAMPRLLGREWSSPGLIKLHFWTATAGVALYWLGLTIGGIHQGLRLNDPAVPFQDVVATTLPYLGLRSAAGYLLLIAHLAFAWLVLRMLAAPERTPAARRGGAA